MADNFDLRKFLKESRALENLNPILRKEKLDEGDLRSKIKEMIIAELGNPDDDYDYDPTDDYGDDESSYYSHMQGLEDKSEEDRERDEAYLDGGFGSFEEGYPEDEEDDYDYSNDYYDGDNYGDSSDFGDTDEFDGYGGYDIDEAKKKDKDVEDVEDVEVTDTETEEVPADEEAPAEEAPAAGGGGLEDIAADMEGTEGDLMDHLMAALKVAKGMNNEKLTTQIGNTLKFFVSEYIGGEEQ